MIEHRRIFVFTEQSDRALLSCVFMRQSGIASPYCVFMRQSSIASPYCVFIKQSSIASPYCSFMEQNDIASSYLVFTGQSDRTLLWVRVMGQRDRTSSWVRVTRSQLQAYSGSRIYQTPQVRRPFCPKPVKSALFIPSLTNHITILIDVHPLSRRRKHEHHMIGTSFHWAFPVLSALSFLFISLVCQSTQQVVLVSGFFHSSSFSDFFG